VNKLTGSVGEPVIGYRAGARLAAGGFEFCGIGFQELLEPGELEPGQVQLTLREAGRLA
jgi:hypothetical protein